MTDATKIAAWGVLALLMAMAANWGEDQTYQIQALILMALAALMFVRSARRRPRPATWTT